MATLSPVSQRPLPIRELLVPSTSHQGSKDGNESGRLPLLKFISRFSREDGENVVFWLHKIEAQFLIYDVAAKNKVYNASRYIYGKAPKYYMYLTTVNDGIASYWKDFRHALISRYHHPAAREKILRHKLEAIHFKGIHRYCQEFRTVEAQVYDMAFLDRLNDFLRKPPLEASLHIRNAAGDTRDMEVVYRLACQWATNVRSTLGSTILRGIRIPATPPHKPCLLILIYLWRRKPTKTKWTPMKNWTS